MKKKRIISGIAILLLVCLGVYFRPMKLTDFVSENNTMSLSASVFGVREGVPYIDTSAYDLTEEQKHELTALPVNTIVISSTGQCAVNDKTYHIRNGGRLVEQMGAVIGKLVPKK